MTDSTAASVAAFDFSSMTPEDVAVLEITRPGAIEGEHVPTGWKITFAGPAHAKTIAWNNEKGSAALRKAQAIEAAQRNGRKIKPDDTTLDEQREDNVRWVLARVIDWTPVTVPWIQSEPIKPTDPAAAKFLLDPRSNFAFAQMVDFLTAEKSFTKRSATT